jgi:hypothetical protein
VEEREGSEQFFDREDFGKQPSGAAAAKAQECCSKMEKPLSLSGFSFIGIATKKDCRKDWKPGNAQRFLADFFFGDRFNDFRPVDRRLAGDPRFFSTFFG